jgi:hypothetical protein
VNETQFTYKYNDLIGKRCNFVDKMEIS